MKKQQPASQAGRRGLRVAEIARSEFTRAVLRRIDDPRLQSLVVVNVHVTDDLSLVDIGVRFVGVDSSDEQRKLLAKLQRALPRLTREIVPRLELRRAPSLRLHFDSGEDATRRVEELLHEIQVESETKPK
ncbi:MAG TPA: 30S ribosome-binding factor RbfA [Polyangiaceae bacterium]|nr:30S ribosome-binding factor RbfA [Polyangiaceae bacterium]